MHTRLAAFFYGALKYSGSNVPYELLPTMEQQQQHPEPPATTGCHWVVGAEVGGVGCSGVGNSLLSLFSSACQKFFQCIVVTFVVE